MKSLLHTVSKFTKYELLLVLLVFFQFFANIAWIGLNTLPFPWDQAGHTLISYRFVDYYQGLLDTPFLRITDYYPPIVHIIVSILMLIFGREPNIGPFVVTLFFLTAIIYLYRYTYELFKTTTLGNVNSKRLALLAAAIFSFLPGLNNLSRYFLLELPFVAFILVALYYLEKSKLFSDKRNSILFGVFAGLALLVKWTAGIYFIVPILFVLIPLFKKELETGFEHFIKRSWLKYGFYSLGILFLIAAPWYFTNYQVIADFSKISATGEASDPQKLLTLENIKFYFYHITNFQITWLGMVAFLLSIPAVLKTNKSIGIKLLVPVLFSYVVFTFIANKDLRYVVFLTPYFSIAIALGLYSLFKGSVKRGAIVTSLFFAFFIMNFFSLAFGFPFDPEKVNRRESIIIPGIGDINIINFGKDTSYYLVPKYTNHVKWPNSTIADELSKHDPNNKIKILVISEKPFFNEVNLNVAAQHLEKRNIKFTAPYRLEPFSSDEEMKTYLSDFSLILIAEKDLGPIDAIRHIVPMRQLKEYIETQRATDIKQINTYFTPDGDKIHVYKGTTIPTNVIIEEMSKHDPANKVDILLVADNPQLKASRFEIDRKAAFKENISFSDPDITVVDIANYLAKYQVLLVSKNSEETPGTLANKIANNPPAYLKKINSYYLPNGDMLDVYRTN